MCQLTPSSMQHDLTSCGSWMESVITRPSCEAVRGIPLARDQGKLQNWFQLGVSKCKSSREHEISPQQPLTRYWYSSNGNTGRQIGGTISETVGCPDQPLGDTQIESTREVEAYIWPIVTRGNSDHGVIRTIGQVVYYGVQWCKLPEHIGVGTCWM